MGAKSADWSSGGEPAVADDLRLRFFDSSPHMIAFWDAEERCVVNNAAHDAFFGRARGSLVGITLEEMLGSAAYLVGRAAILDALAGVEQHFSAGVRDGRGHVRQLEVHYVPQREPHGFFAVAVDVTERHNAERSLRQAELIAGLGSWMADGESEPILSPAMHALLGHRTGSWTPTWDAISEHVHPEDRRRVWDTAVAARDRGEGFEMEYRIVRPGGEVRVVRARCDAEHSRDGELLRRHGTELDVTDLRQAEDDLRAAHARLATLNQAQADLIAMLGHDAKQPLTSVRGHLETVIEDWATLPESLKESSVRRAATAARRLGNLLDEILAMANLESSQDDETLPVSPRDVLLAEAVGEAVENAPEREGVRVEVPAALRVHVDPWHLRQILANLLGNALKYGTSPVVVSARLPPSDAAAADGAVGLADGVELRVQDSGEGVPISFVDKLFGRFERAQEGVATTKRGNGFGLYIVKRMVEANEGSIRYEPAPVRGACFIVTLPAG